MSDGSPSSEDMNHDRGWLRSPVAETALALVVCYVAVVAFLTIFNATLPTAESLVPTAGFVVAVILPVEIAIYRGWRKAAITGAVALGVVAGSAYRWYMIPESSREMGFGLSVVITALVFAPPAFAALAVYRYRLIQARGRNSGRPA